MSYVDLQSALREWCYDPEQISVRKILGADGEVRLQMRIELGIIQMETEGRADGTRPHGCSSLLQYHRKRLATYTERNGTSLGFEITPEECCELRTEASLYYRRYIALFVLEEFDSVTVDTTHSLDIFDLCRDYAEEPEDRAGLEPFRSYVLMMDARARAYHALAEDEPSSALAHINRGILNLRNHFESLGDYESVENSEEMKMLHSLASDLAYQMPQDSLVVTRKALRSAIENEHFEEAARLRDELQTLLEPESH